jgi:hypothetical protein
MSLRRTQLAPPPARTQRAPHRLAPAEDAAVADSRLRLARLHAISGDTAALYEAALVETTSCTMTHLPSGTIAPFATGSLSARGLPPVGPATYVAAPSLTSREQPQARQSTAPRAARPDELPHNGGGESALLLLRARHAKHPAHALPPLAAAAAAAAAAPALPPSRVVRAVSPQRNARTMRRKQLAAKEVRPEWVEHAANARAHLDVVSSSQALLARAGQLVRESSALFAMPAVAVGGLR